MLSMNTGLMPASPTFSLGAARKIIAKAMQAPLNLQRIEEKRAAAGSVAREIYDHILNKLIVGIGRVEQRFQTVGGCQAGVLPADEPCQQ